ncbi:MAG: WYL domain-containing protein, partial [Verrucomicrobiae bacterium]|nr:WYL domain-containing protein [Verrucomicrobiae bacterium]
MSPRSHATKKTAAKSGGTRAGGTRRPLERIVRIHEAINRGRFPNCSGIARELETSRKTIQRDVNFMRDQLELPIAYHELEHGYYYTEPVAQFPFLQTTAEDLVALIVARNALRHLADTPLLASLRHSLQKLQQGMQDRVSIPWSNLDQAFSVKADGLSRRDLGLFDKIASAIIEQRELRFDYTKLDAKKAEPRHLQPYHLAEIDGGWYVIGHDVDRGARRTFAVQRMKGLSLQQKTFPRADDFRLEDHFAGSFGVWTLPDDGD